MGRKHHSIHKNIDIDEVIDKSNEIYVSDEPGDSSFTVDDANDFLSKSFLENISPVKYQVNKIKVDELASYSVRYHKQKFEEVLNSVTENYLKRVAPGQEKEFLEILTGSDDSKNDDHELTLLFPPTVLKELDVALEKGKHCLKTSFSRHCANNAETGTHCICHALYNPTDPDFQGKTWQEHLKICVNCIELLPALENN